MAAPVLIDTGPLVAVLNRRDQWHEWAKGPFASAVEPFLTCEAVLSEAFHLLEGIDGGTRSLAALLRRGVIRCAFSLEDDREAVMRLMEKYADLPAAFADACLVRMSERHETARVFTTDADFKVYRKTNRRTIPLICPPGV